MSFSLSNTTITQTGIDTNLTGIATMVAAIPVVAAATAYSVNTYIKPPSANGFIYRCTVAGTTGAVAPTYGMTAGGTTVDGTASFLAVVSPYSQVVGSRTVYRISTFQAAFNGTLTWDAKLEGLEFYGCPTSTVLTFNSPAVITINSVINGKATYEEGLVIRPSVATVQTELRINSGVTFNLNGARINLSGIGSSDYQSVYINKGATINITNGWIKSSKNQVRWGESGTGNMLGMNINGLIAEKIFTTIFGVFGSLSGLAPLNSVTQTVSYGAFTFFTLRDYSPLDAGSFLDNYDIPNLYVVNSLGSGLDYRSGKGPGKWISLQKEFTLTTLTAAGAAINGAVAYVRDTNNAGRVNIPAIPNQLSDNVYIQSTTGAGVTPTMALWVMHAQALSGYQSIPTRDYRTKTTVAGDDFFDVSVLAYGYVYALLSNVPMKGAGVLALSSNLIADANITLTEAAAVAKLASSFSVAGNVLTVTASSTLDDIYDALKAYKTRPVQAQVEYPTISAQPVTASGTQLSTAMSIVVNSGVTLTAGSKFKSIACAGVTLLGSATAISIVGNVTQATPTDLTGVSITGTLTYNTASTAQFTFSNSTLATVTNSGAGIVTIKRINSTLTAGTNVVAYLPTTLNFNLNGGRIRVLNHLGIEQFNQTTDGSFELPVSATGTWSYKIAKYGSKVIENTFSIDGTTKAITPSYIPDTLVFDTLASVSAYTALDTTQKIYDYYSFYLASASGITQAKSVTGTPALLDLGAYNLTAGAISVSATTIATGSVSIHGINVTTTGSISGISPAYPQQLTSISGTTNWLKVTLTAGQVFRDTFNNTFLTNSTITFLPASFTLPISIFVTRRGYKKQSVTIPYSTNLLPEQAFTLIPDTNVLDLASDLSSANLTSSQLIYDAFSQYQSSSSGILDLYTPTKAPGSIDFSTKGFSLGTTTDFSLSPLRTKSSNLTGDAYYSQQAFVQGSATLANSVLIRASNLNSELVFTPDSLIFYPTATDRDSGTNGGLTVTGGVYRFLYGSVVYSVSLSGTIYLRVTVGGLIFFADLPIVSGANVMDLGVQGQLTAISAKLDTKPSKAEIPALVWDESTSTHITAGSFGVDAKAVKSLANLIPATL